VAENSDIEEAMAKIRHGENARRNRAKKRKNIYFSGGAAWLRSAKEKAACGPRPSAAIEKENSQLMA